MLCRLAYTSRLKPHIDDDEVEEIVRSAAEFNALNDVTGVIAFEGDRVCQILEGEEATIDALYTRIGNDVRHTTVTTLLTGPIDYRHFVGWAMVRRSMIDIATFAFSLGDSMEPA